MPEGRHRFGLPIAVLVGAFAVGVIGRYVVTESSPEGSATDTSAASATAEAKAYARIGGPFSLIDHRRRTTTDRDFRGGFMLIYFGYTFCPDICPTELLIMGQAIDRLGPAGERVQPIFITIDPGRDTAGSLRKYVGNFHPRLIGLGGTAGQVAAAAKAYGVFYSKASAAAGTDGPGEYLMDHSSFVYLVGPKGRVRTMFSRGTDPDKMAGRIRLHLDGGQGSAAARSK